MKTNADGTYKLPYPCNCHKVEATFSTGSAPEILPDPLKPPVWKNPFKDVANNAWYYDDVAFVYQKGLFSGIGDGMFSPTASMTRGMLVTVLYRLEGEPAVIGTNPFGDVSADKWYEKAVIWAAHNKIVEGYETKRFGPNDDISREQMATILWRYAKYKGYDVKAATELSKFRDKGKISIWAEAAMSWANATYLINGKGGGILDPKAHAERCQVAAILHRFCKNIAK